MHLEEPLQRVALAYEFLQLLYLITGAITVFTDDCRHHCHLILPIYVKILFKTFAFRLESGFLELY